MGTKVFTLADGGYFYFATARYDGVLPTSGSVSVTLPAGWVGAMSCGNMVYLGSTSLKESKDYYFLYPATYFYRQTGGGVTTQLSQSIRTGSHLLAGVGGSMNTSYNLEFRAFFFIIDNNDNAAVAYQSFRITGSSPLTDSDRTFVVDPTGVLNHVTYYRHTPITYSFTITSNGYTLGNYLYKYTVPNVDPYDPGGTTDVGGGTGNHNNTGTDPQLPTNPTLNALSAKFISLYSPTQTQLDNLATYLWAGTFADDIKKMFADPMQAIIGLSIVPVDVPVPTGAPPALKIGNINTGVGVYQASQQFITVDCGTLAIDEYWGSYLDYSPYTKIDIYLPYIGMQQISTDDVMGKTVGISYIVDILSGACCACIKVDGVVLYNYAGSCSMQLPISSLDMSSVISSAVSVALSVGGAVVGAVSGSPVGAAAAVGLVASSASNVMQMKPQIKKGGTISGVAGFLAPQTPYIIITRPRQALPDEQNTFTGYPSFITETLGSLTGFTMIENVHLENIPATGDELAEIETLLKSGVIF